MLIYDVYVSFIVVLAATIVIVAIILVSPDFVILVIIVRCQRLYNADSTRLMASCAVGMYVCVTVIMKR